MSNPIVAAMLAQLQQEPNLKDIAEVQGDTIYFHTKGDPDNFDDPEHSLSSTFWQLMEQHGLDSRMLFENDCEGCAGEFSLNCSKPENPAITAWRNKVQGAGGPAFEAAVAYCRSVGLDFQMVTCMADSETYQKQDTPFKDRIVHTITIHLVKAE